MAEVLRPPGKDTKGAKNPFARLACGYPTDLSAGVSRSLSPFGWRVLRSFGYFVFFFSFFIFLAVDSCNE
ncbi:MAG: hypothetical protein LBU80_02735 [Rikenellaceae bacterium]|jgi:tellurite resistance protein TehA-like permease|nr:hypothetical protein [Rikenellaceae bacterium]